MLHIKTPCWFIHIVWTNFWGALFVRVHFVPSIYMFIVMLVNVLSLKFSVRKLLILFSIIKSSSSYVFQGLRKITFCVCLSINFSFRCTDTYFLNLSFDGLLASYFCTCTNIGRQNVQRKKKNKVQTK